MAAFLLQYDVGYPTSFVFPYKILNYFVSIYKQICWDFSWIILGTIFILIFSLPIGEMEYLDFLLFLSAVICSLMDTDHVYVLDFIYLFFWYLMVFFNFQVPVVHCWYKGKQLIFIEGLISCDFEVGTTFRKLLEIL
jgi:hypothetical protein